MNWLNLHRRNPNNLRAWAPALCLLAVALLIGTPTKAPPNCDKDGDGFEKAGGACGGDDCKDNDRDINPDATEVCDGVDNNCNGQTDEGGVCGGGSGEFNATATIIQSLQNGCDRKDDYDLGGCTGEGQHECTQIDWTSVEFRALPDPTWYPTPAGCSSPPSYQTENPSPGDVQTGLWNEFFDPPWDILDVTTDVDVFMFREITQEGFHYSSLGLSTSQYGKGKVPNNMWAGVCSSVSLDDPPTPVSSPALPLQPPPASNDEDKARLVCEKDLFPANNPVLYLRKGGGNLAEDPILLPHRVEVIMQRLD